MVSFILTKKFIKLIVLLDLQNQQPLNSILKECLDFWSALALKWLIHVFLDDSFPCRVFSLWSSHTPWLPMRSSQLRLRGSICTWLRGPCTLEFRWCPGHFQVSILEQFLSQLIWGSLWNQIPDFQVSDLCEWCH